MFFCENPDLRSGVSRLFITDHKVSLPRLFQKNSVYYYDLLTKETKNQNFFSTFTFFSFIFSSTPCFLRFKHAVKIKLIPESISKQLIQNLSLLLSTVVMCITSDIGFTLFQYSCLKVLNLFPMVSSVNQVTLFHDNFMTRISTSYVM